LAVPNSDRPCLLLLAHLAVHNSDRPCLLLLAHLAVHNSDRPCLLLLNTKVHQHLVRRQYKVHLNTLSNFEN